MVSQFQPDAGILNVERLDRNGLVVEIINKYFPLPPKPICSQTTYGAFLSSLALDGIVPQSLSSNMTSDSNIQCCDFYSNGLGY
jgi:hypothetical protein